MMAVDLDAVRLRHKRYESLRGEPLSMSQLAAIVATAADVPALIAEIEILRRRVQDGER